MLRSPSDMQFYEAIRVIQLLDHEAVRLNTVPLRTDGMS